MLKDPAKNQNPKISFAWAILSLSELIICWVEYKILFENDRILKSIWTQGF